LSATGRNELIEAANSALKNAYSPYSKFRVGAAIRSNEGKIFTGCNIENASYSLAVCAERVALFKAVSEGYKTFDSIAICSSGVKPAFPCGACRQVLMEFNPDLRIYLDQVPTNYQLSDLISHPFSRDQMILSESDKKVIGTRYLELLCAKTQENQGKRFRFSKIEVYGIDRLDGYNRDIVIPPIIRKLKQLGYIEEYENDEISLTPLGKKNCGKQVVVDQII
jgi:cytidine deaminase